ncbi:PTS sugar transporter subunit IIC [Lactobacillus sp. ESL0684]|uniref:PTS sugar transporter subunit IIC n=1 Tax=unclassified Lactobacillus TaxID=2620435 RepID=UPI0023F7339C|nr:MULTISPECIES: PTS sugar transporter subunit IIC [unclassified Lactobacillus]WEV40129.1 PTS sugar transporter subunit IIC [Lactobacillus sp. ESL0681]WEV43333.1 PTS sugar transporter subunit IIC [Lactobacillus sp. ESL0684]
MKQTKNAISAKEFFNKVLSGTATGIIVGLIPNAVLSSVLKLFGNNAITIGMNHVLLVFQIATPLLIGALIAYQFEFAPLDIAVVAASAYVGSGVTQFNAQAVNPANKQAGIFISSGTGDLINTMITAAIAVFLTLVIGNLFGSVKIVLNPIVVGGGASYIGYLLLPLISKITTGLGTIINSFTKLQPVLMCVLIAWMFALLIVTPVSTVAIGMAIQLNGIAAGAAAMGVAATTIVLVVHSWKVNKSGVTIAVALGAMKMMIPNLFRYPIIVLPILITSAASALPVALWNICGTPASAGFGLVGIVGPLASMSGPNSINLLLALLSWFVIPAVVALACRFVFDKWLHVYDEKVAFAYLGD